MCCVLPYRYDKPGTMSKGRKIGHINVVAPTRAEARQRLAAIEAAGEQSLR
jgi:phosphoribosylaminoimidazole carboxylase (NCAIR synthetase)